MRLIFAITYTRFSRLRFILLRSIDSDLCISNNMSFWFGSLGSTDLLLWCILFAYSFKIICLGIKLRTESFKMSGCFRCQKVSFRRFLTETFYSLYGIRISPFSNWLFIWKVSFSLLLDLGDEEEELKWDIFECYTECKFRVEFILDSELGKKLSDVKSCSLMENFEMYCLEH